MIWDSCSSSSSRSCLARFRCLYLTSSRIVSSETFIYSKSTATQLQEGNGNKVLGYLHGINSLTINEDNRLRKQVTVQLVESNRQDQKPKEQIERILNVILNDQEQVRAIGASPYFKKKLQEGKSKNKFHRVNILGSELSQGICSVCQRVCDQQCGECMKYFCEVHIKEHASAHR